jgi:hypothetical protein
MDMRETAIFSRYSRDAWLFKYWLNFEVKKKLWPRKKIFVDSRQERFQLTNLSLILLEVSILRHGHLEQN